MTTIKHIKSYLGIFISSLAVFSASCSKDFLDEVPKSFGAPENFYKTEAHAIQALNGVYDGLQPIVEGSNGLLQMSLATDIMRGNQWGGTSGLKAYIISPDETDISNYWRHHYSAIKNANTAIDNIPKVNLPEDKQNHLIGQAKFIRALLYFNLVRTFGEVPYTISEFTSLGGLKVPRNSVEEIYDGITEDLLFAIEFVAPKASLGSYDGHATRESAEGLLAKVYLTRGSMEKRDGKGNGMEFFREAVKHSNNVITSGKYVLNNYFPDAFIKENKNNDEIIFDVQFKRGGIGEGNYLGMGYGLMGPENYGGSWGTLHSSRYFHVMYDKSDSVRQEWTTTQATVNTKDVNGVTVGYINHTRGPETNERWKMAKFRRYPVRGPFTYNDFDMNWPFMRYAEVLLIYAEALNEVDNGPSSNALNALNQLRWRARHVNVGDIHEDEYPRTLTYVASNVPDIQIGDYPTYDALKDYIMDERARELGGEGTRWFDLVRWGKLEERLRLLENPNIFPEGERTDAEDGWHKDISVNFKPYHILMPIPSAEIQANPALAPQTKGY